MKRILYNQKDSHEIILIQDDHTIDNYNLFICKNYFTILKEKYENIKFSDAFLIIEKDYGVKELFERKPFLEAENKEKIIRLVVEDGGQYHDTEVGYYLYVIDLKTGKCTYDWHCDNIEQVYSMAEDYGVAPEDFKEIDFNKIPLAE